MSVGQSGVVTAYLLPRRSRHDLELLYPGPGFKRIVGLTRNPIETAAVTRSRSISSRLVTSAVLKKTAPLPFPPAG